MPSLTNPPPLTTAWQIKTSNYLAKSGDRIVANLTSGAWSLTLPANPAIGEEVQILTFGSTTNALTVDPNGKPVNGANAPLAVVGERLKTHFVFVGVAGWISAVGGGSASPSPSPSPSPTPSPLTDYVTWLRADQGTTLDTSGGITTVSLWADQSHHNVHCDETVKGSQPLYIQNALNGRPVLRFTGSQRLRSANPFPVSGSAPRHFFAVARRTGSNQAQVILHLGNVNATYESFGLDSGSPSFYAYTWGEDIVVGGRPANFEIYSFSYDGSNLSLRINGVLQATRSRLLATLPSQLWIGMRDQPGSGFIGDIAEVICFDRVLTAAETQQREQQLATRWGITI